MMFNKILDGLQDHLAAAGYGDVRPTHFNNVFRFLDCGGVRPTALAQRAGMTPQAMSELVVYLERRGYVHRIADPSDKRGRIVVLADRGLEAAQVAASYYAELEIHWAAHVGPEQLQHIASGLALMLEEDGKQR